MLETDETGVQLLARGRIVPVECCREAGERGSQRWAPERGLRGPQIALRNLERGWGRVVVQQTLRVEAGEGGGAGEVVYVAQRDDTKKFRANSNLIPTCSNLFRLAHTYSDLL